MKRLKNEQYFWIIYGAFLLLLFLMSSTDLIIKENEQTIRAVSVIVDDSTDSYYVNFRKGMDQAAIDYNIDANFITLYERNNAINQMDLLEREVADGADGVVAVPVDNLKFSERLDKAAAHVPLIVMDSEWSSSWVHGNITMDYYEAGRTLAEEMLADAGRQEEIILLTEGLKYASNARFYDGIAAVMEEMGRSFRLCDSAGEETFRELLSRKEGRCALAALDKETLTVLARSLEGLQNGKERFRLYGQGVNMEILSYLEEGIIDGVVTPNQYDEGYLAMEMVLEVIETPGAVRKTRIMEHYYIEKDDIRSREYEKMLFPIQ